MPGTEVDPSNAPQWDFVGHYVGRKSIVPDWGAVGQYAAISSGVLPIARAVIEAAQIKKGEAVLDVGSRCGDWALLAAEAGAQVTGIDFSPSLLEAARAKLKDHPGARFELADVARLPFAGASFDAVIDVMTLIFGADREAALSEITRVLKPSGRIVWSGWSGRSAIHEAAMITAAATANIIGHEPYPYSYWGEEDDIRGLFAAQGLEIRMATYPMVATAPSPEALIDMLNEVHPINVGCNAVLEKAGVLEEISAKVLETLNQYNEDPSALKLSRRFAVGVATRKA